MARKTSRNGNRTDSQGGPLGIEAQLWAAADALRNNMDAAEYKHVVLGLIFLKYISDAFDAIRQLMATPAPAKRRIGFGTKEDG